MKHCKTCKWWKRIKRYKWGWCENETVVYQVPPPDGMTDVTTHEDFGCIHHEAKKGEKK